MQSTYLAGRQHDNRRQSCDMVSLLDMCEYTQELWKRLAVRLQRHI